MKNPGTVLTVLFLTLNTAISAGSPESSSFTKDKGHTGSLHQNTNSIFVFTQKKQNSALPGFAFKASGTMHTNYITGQTKKTESKVSRLLGWDFKVKFKLNQHMNIIFSYN